MISIQTGSLTNNHNSPFHTIVWIQWRCSPSKAVCNMQKKDDDWGLEVRLQFFSSTLIMDLLLRKQFNYIFCKYFVLLHLLNGIQSGKNYCTSKVARKNKTDTVQDICTRSHLILHIYKANHFTFKRKKKAILDEHFSTQHI